MIDVDREANRYLDPSYAFYKNFIRILDFQHSCKRITCYFVHNPKTCLMSGSGDSEPPFMAAPIRTNLRFYIYVYEEKISNFSYYLLYFGILY